MDAEALDWSFNSFALVEAAGRRAARVLAEGFPGLFEGTGPSTVVLAGTGNNAADAAVILRSLILDGLVAAERALLVMTRAPDAAEKGPWPEACRSLQKMGVRALVFSVPAAEGEIRERPEGPLGKVRLVIDGIAGTGLRGPLREDAALPAQWIRMTADRPLVAAVDLPSGLFEGWKPGMPVVDADAVLAIEPEKRCLYNPAARSHCGRILHVGGVFPAALTEKYREAELVTWDYCRTLIPPVSADSYKYSRGLLEIRAGSPGAAGAARIAARGAQAAGAGLVRLLVDPPLYPVLAASASSVMVDWTGREEGPPRFVPDALLLGPGWGRGPDRQRALEDALALEERGIPLVLDADAIFLARDRVFHGNALLCPHPGELAAYSGIPREELLADPGPALLALAAEKRAVILFKSHVMIAASTDGRLAVVDGMNPVLAAGGSGDLLAGFCAALALRRPAGPDLFSCALAGASLLIRSAADPRVRNRFADSLELADIAAELAGRAWLPQKTETESLYE
jgi:NAD(P)H-hydrate epimerase